MLSLYEEIEMPLVFSLYRMEKEGIAAYCFDFIGGGPEVKSEGTMREMSVLSETEDLLAVMDAIRELEEEIGINIFIRSNRGISLTPEGEEFVGYAKQVVTQYELIENKYITGGKIKKRFSVSAQHYAFAVDAFAKMVEEFGMDGYDFAMYETKTYDVIQDVKKFKSEIGILYLNDFNRKIITKLLDENELEFHPLLDCGVYAYMWKKHPLAKKKRVTFDELNSYPCIIFEQGINNSFYFAEEMFSTYQFNQTLRVCDRATGLNLMIGLNAFTVCSGII